MVGGLGLVAGVAEWAKRSCWANWFYGLVYLSLSKDAQAHPNYDLTFFLQPPAVQRDSILFLLPPAPPKASSMVQKTRGEGDSSPPASTLDLPLCPRLHFGSTPANYHSSLLVSSFLWSNFWAFKTPDAGRKVACIPGLACTQNRELKLGTTEREWLE